MKDRVEVEGALRQPFFATLVALIAFGIAVQHVRPDAHSIGDLLRPAECADCR